MNKEENAPGSQPIDGPLIDVREVYLTLLRGLGHDPQWPANLIYSTTFGLTIKEFMEKIYFKRSSGETFPRLMQIERELREAISLIPDFWESLTPRENVVWPEGVLYTAQRLPTRGKPVIVQTAVWLTKNCPHKDWSLRVEEDG